MTTTAAPGTPARPTARAAGRSAAVPAPVAPPAATPAGSRPSGFRAAVVLAVLLTGPAVYLVAKGELSAHDALVRFGCAWAFATGGVALVLSTVGGGSPIADDLSQEGAGGGAPAAAATPAAGDADPPRDTAYDTAHADSAHADPARVDDAPGTPAG